MRDTRLPAVIEDSFQVGSSSILTHSLNTLLPLRGEDGQALLHNIIVRPISSGRSNHCLLQINDVTVSVTRERVLRERQNARYHAIVDSAPDAIITTGLDRTIQWLNGAAEHVFGYAPSELLGQKIDVLLEQDGEISRAFGGDAADVKGSTSSFQVVGRRKQGRPAHFDVSFAHWRRRRARIRNHDLAGRHGADGGRHRAARERRASPRAAGGVAATGLDLRGRWPVRLFQSAMAGLHRRSGARAFRLGLAQGGPCVGSRRVGGRVEALAGHRRTYSMPMPAFVDASGSHRWFKMRSIPVRTADGKITRWFGTATDITELVEARDSLRSSNEELEARVLERTREHEIALRQLHEVPEDGEHRSADRWSGARLQQFARGHPWQPGALEKETSGRCREPPDCWKAPSKARSVERRSPSGYWHLRDVRSSSSKPSRFKSSFPTCWISCGNPSVRASRSRSISCPMFMRSRSMPISSSSHS